MSRFSGPFPGDKFRSRPLGKGSKRVLRKLRVLRREEAEMRSQPGYVPGSFSHVTFTREIL